MNFPDKNEAFVLPLLKLYGEIDSAKVVKKKTQFILVFIKARCVLHPPTHNTYSYLPRLFSAAANLVRALFNSMIVNDEFTGMRHGHLYKKNRKQKVHKRGSGSVC